MNKTLDDYIKNLPPYIGKEIFKFIIHDSFKIKFHYFDNYKNYYFSPRLTVACINEKLIENEKETIISRIRKNNVKHRYYLTDEYKITYCTGCGKEYSERCCGCRGDLYYEYHYKHKYIGKDIDKVLLELYLEDK
jgi:hypothetical protein